MSRDDLLMANYEVVKTATSQAAKLSPNAILVLVTNPLDAMCWTAKKISGFPRERVIGMAGVLDTARFRTFIAEELNVSFENVTAMVLGGHGDTMVPLVRFTNVSGIPLTELTDQATIDKLVQRTRDGGAEIVKYLKTGSAYYAPAASTVENGGVHSEGQEESSSLRRPPGGEYGIHGLFVGVPVKLGKDGVEKVYEIKLDAARRPPCRRAPTPCRNLLRFSKKKRSKSS